MRITRVEVFTYDLSYVHGSYVMSGGRVVERLPSTVVRISTDEGVEGFGETCPLGPAYLPAHARGALAALHELAPALIGLDPRESWRINDAMDAALLGHGYAKSALDMACWDISGRSMGVPLCVLLGGRRQESFPLYVAVPLGSSEQMAAQVEELRGGGVHHFQLKLGAEPREDARRVRAVLEATGDDDVVVADANGGWRLQDAVVAARLLDGLERVYLEQPCPTLEECLYVRRLSRLPLVLDELISDVGSFLAAWQVGAMDAINLKLSKLGGLTRARQLRDLAGSLGVSMTIEDTWGGDLVTAAVSHLAASTRAETLFTVSFMNDWSREHLCGYQPRSERGVGAAPHAPGLGVEVELARLGAPLLSVEA